MSTARDPLFGCELVTHRLDRDGYAFQGSSRAHIVAWVAANGPVPDGMVLEHWCARRNCRAVHHLEPVTQSENLKRRSWRYKMAMKACPKGHDLSINRIIVPPRGQVCRQCNKEAEKGI
jgi:hypothetical protein